MTDEALYVLERRRLNLKDYMWWRWNIVLQVEHLDTGQRQSRPSGLGLLPGVLRVASGCTSLGNMLVRCGTQH
eukprot:2006955-Rhodomonas_salina.1